MQVQFNELKNAHDQLQVIDWVRARERYERDHAATLNVTVDDVMADYERNLYHVAVMGTAMDDYYCFAYSAPHMETVLQMIDAAIEWLDARFDRNRTGVR